MTKTALENKKLEQTRIENAKDRSQERKIAKDSNTTKLGGDTIKALGSIGGAALKGLLQDPSWYKQYIVELDNFVNVPTYDRLGSNTLEGVVSTDSTDMATYGIAGIMILPYLPTIGNQETSAVYFRNPINQTLAREKEKVLALNSRSGTNWEPSDLGYNTNVSACIMTLILELGRVISVYDTYHGENAYLAKALIEALGFSYSDIEQYYAEYRRSYVKLVHKFNSSIVAPGMSLFQRRAYLASNVFIDTDNVKRPRQMYAYTMNYTFDLSDDATFCALETVTNKRSSIVTYVAFIYLLMEHITANQDFVEMYQDLRHAYGNNLVTLSDKIPEAIVFNNNPLNREQIHNHSCMPLLWSTSGEEYSEGILTLTDWYLRQDASGYLYQGSSNGSNNRLFKYTDIAIANTVKLANHIGTTSKHVLNVHSDTVDGDTILDITRWQYNCGLVKSGTTLNCTLLNCGTEFGLPFHVYEMKSDGNVVDHLGSSIIMEYRDGSNVFDFIHNRYPGVMSNFDWHPISISEIECVDTDLASALITRTLMDARTTFVIGTTVMAALNEVAVMSEFYLPDTGYYKNK